MTSLQDKIDALSPKYYSNILEKYHPVIPEVNKAIQEFRETIDNYPILDLKNVVTPKARNAVQEFQTIVLALIGEKSN